MEHQAADLHWQGRLESREAVLSRSGGDHARPCGCAAFFSGSSMRNADLPEQSGRADRPRSPLIPITRPPTTITATRCEPGSPIRRLRVIDPADPATLNNRGAVCTLDRPPFSPGLSYDRALALQPGHAAAHKNRANSSRSPDLDEAMSGYEQALALRPPQDAGASLRPRQGLYEFSCGMRRPGEFQPWQ